AVGVLRDGSAALRSDIASDLPWSVPEVTAPAPAAAPAPLAPACELTARAALAGVAVGVLLGLANVYMGLKTGMFDSGSIAASFLAFGLLSSARRLGGPPSPLETNVAQALAASLGSMPSAAGLLAAIPALELMGRAPSGWIVAGWGLALGTLG